jgi:hypothetical protein
MQDVKQNSTIKKLSSPKTIPAYYEDNATVALAYGAFPSQTMRITKCLRQANNGMQQCIQHSSTQHPQQP